MISTARLLESLDEDTENEEKKTENVAYGLNAFAEAGTVVIAGVGQRFIEADVFRSALGDLMDLVAALLRCQFLPKVLQAEDDGGIITGHTVQRLLRHRHNEHITLMFATLGLYVSNAKRISSLPLNAWSTFFSISAKSNTAEIQPPKLWIDKSSTFWKPHKSSMSSAHFSLKLESSL